MLLVFSALAQPLSFSDAITRVQEGPLGQQLVWQERAWLAQAIASDIENPSFAIEKDPDGIHYALELPLDPAAIARIRAGQRAQDVVRQESSIAHNTLSLLAATTWLEAKYAYEIGQIYQQADIKLDFSDYQQDHHTRILIQAYATQLWDQSMRAQQASDALISQLGSLLGQVFSELGSWPTLSPPQAPEILPQSHQSQLRTRAALASAHAAQWEALPQATLGGGWSTGSHTGPLFSFSLELPLFAPGIVPAKAAGAEVEIARLQEEITHLETASLIAQAQARLDFAAQRLARWQVIDLSSGLESLNQKQQAGELSSLDYLRYRDELLQASETALNARLGYNHAILALCELYGTLPEVIP